MHKEKVVVFFTGYFLPFLGGIERYTDKLAGSLRGFGYKVVIITSNHDNLPSFETIDDVDIYRIPVMNIFKNRYPIPVLGRRVDKIICKVFSKHQPDYVICNTRFHLTTLLGLKWAKRNGIDPLIIEHGSSHFSIGVPVLDCFGKIYEHLLTMRVKKYCNRFYGVSGRCNEWLKHFNIKAKGVFYNSTEDRDSGYVGEINTPWHGKPLVITYAGRIIKEKGVQMLLESFSSIPDTLNGRRTVLAIAGDGPLLESLVYKYDSFDNIYFLGKLDYKNILSLLKNTDIFCYPSMYPEGLPTSILEAGMMGCAVVATDRGGTAEVVISGEDGIIVKEDKESLKKAIIYLLNDSKSRLNFARRLQAKIKRDFTWTNTAKVVHRELGG